MKFCKIGLHKFNKKTEQEVIYSGWSVFYRYFKKCKNCDKKKYIHKNI